MIVPVIILIVVIALVAMLIVTYNRLGGLRQRANSAFSAQWDEALERLRAPVER